MTDKPKRRWYQYSLRSLFVLTTLVAIACSWYAWEMNEAAERRAAIAKIEKAGGNIGYYDPLGKFFGPGFGDPPRWYSWLRRLHGDVHLGNVVAIDVYDPFVGPSKPRCVTDADLVHLNGLTKLETLSLAGMEITDAGLGNLEGLTTLKSLELGRTQITDAGLLNLKGLTKLHSLSLRSTQITDAGILHLKDLPNLQWLYLGSTKVTDEGVSNLQEALPNCKIWRADPPIMIDPK